MCCLICATVIHRNCRYVLDVAGQAAITDMDAITQNLISDLTSAKAHMRNIVKQHVKSNEAIRFQIDEEIPKQLNDLRKRIDDKLSEMETLILSAAKTEGKKEITDSVSQFGWLNKNMKAATDACHLLQTIADNGSDAHLYIAINKFQKTLDNMYDGVLFHGRHVFIPSIEMHPTDLLHCLASRNATNLASLIVKTSSIPLTQYIYNTCTENCEIQQKQTLNSATFEKPLNLFQELEQNENEGVVCGQQQPKVLSL